MKNAFYVDGVKTCHRCRVGVDFYGAQTVCKTCVKIRSWREANAEYLRKYDKDRYYGPARQRRLLLCKLASSKRKARIRGNGGTLTIKEWEHIVAYYDGRCAYCFDRPKKLTIEHVIPISKGGRHDSTNVVPACSTCNFAKKTKTAAEFVFGRG